MGVLSLAMAVCAVAVRDAPVPRPEPKFAWSPWDEPIVVDLPDRIACGPEDFESREHTAAEVAMIKMLRERRTPGLDPAIRDGLRVICPSMDDRRIERERIADLFPVLEWPTFRRVGCGSVLDDDGWHYGRWKSSKLRRSRPPRIAPTAEERTLAAALLPVLVSIRFPFGTPPKFDRFVRTMAKIVCPQRTKEIDAGHLIELEPNPRSREGCDLILLTDRPPRDDARLFP